jgi:hypothetical protein
MKLPALGGEEPDSEDGHEDRQHEIPVEPLRTSEQMRRVGFRSGRRRLDPAIWTDVQPARRLRRGRLDPRNECSRVSSAALELVDRPDARTEPSRQVALSQSSVVSSLRNPRRDAVERDPGSSVIPIRMVGHALTCVRLLSTPDP